MTLAAALLSVVRGRQRYDPVSDSDAYNENGAEEQKNSEQRSNRESWLTKSWVSIAWLGIAFFITALVSFILGARYASTTCAASRTAASANDAHVIAEVPLGTVTSTYQYNNSFAQIPVKGESEPSWDSLIPVGLGYVHSEDPNSNNLSVVSVFHQLHCLYTLRRAFFSSTGYNASNSSIFTFSPSSLSSSASPPLEDFDFGLERLPHAQHCFEYLRLSLMCNADSRVEPIDLTAGEFFGWDVPRQCRNYEELKDWAEKRRAFNATGFLAPEVVGGKIKVHGHGNGHSHSHDGATG